MFVLPHAQCRTAALIYREVIEGLSGRQAADVLSRGAIEVNGVATGRERPSVVGPIPRDVNCGGVCALQRLASINLHVVESAAADNKRTSLHTQQACYGKRAANRCHIARSSVIDRQIVERSASRQRLGVVGAIEDDRSGTRSKRSIVGPLPLTFDCAAAERPWSPLRRICTLCSCCCW